MAAKPKRQPGADAATEGARLPSVKVKKKHRKKTSRGK